MVKEIAIECAKRIANGEKRVSVAQSIGVSPSLLGYYLKSHGLYECSHISNHLGNAIMNEHKNGLSAANIASNLGMSTQRIRKFLIKKGLFKPSYGRLYKHDDNFFEFINDEVKAYVLGFLMADGYVNRNNLSITIHNQDRDILEKIKLALKSEAPITVLNKGEGNYIRLVLNSQQLSDALTLKGCGQAKTHKIVFPEWLDKDLHPHLIRGYFDGDGCIWVGARNSHTFEMVGTEQFLSSVQNIFIKNCDVKVTQLNRRFKERENSIRNLRYGGNAQVQRIYRWLYQGATIYGQRKYDKFSYLRVEYLSYEEKRPSHQCHQCGSEFKRNKSLVTTNKAYCGRNCYHLSLKKRKQLI